MEVFRLSDESTRPQEEPIAPAEISEPPVPQPHEPVPPHYRPRPPAGSAGVWKGVLITCAVMTLIGVLILLLIGAYMFHFFSSEKGKALLKEAMHQGVAAATCQENLQQIGQALERYRIANQRYPDKLEALYPDFLTRREVLRCPSDSRGPVQAIYDYRRPDVADPKETVVILCKLHRMGAMPVTIVLRKDGTVRQE